MIRYTSLERVWFGYRFFGSAAYVATMLHMLVYAAGAYGLITLRRWGWYLVIGYVLYIPLSECIFLLLYPFGYLTGQPYPLEIVRAQWSFMAVSAVLEIFIIAMLWRFRGLFTH